LLNVVIVDSLVGIRVLIRHKLIYIILYEMDEVTGKKLRDFEFYSQFYENSFSYM